MAAVLLTALLVCSMAAPALAANDGDTTARESRNGVARVLTMIDTKLYDAETGKYITTISGQSIGTGSAFGVGTAGEETDTFVTNRHVVTTDEPSYGTVNGTRVIMEPVVAGVYILLNSYAFNVNTFELDSSRAVPCSVLYIGESEDADVAVIKAAEPVEGRVALPLLDDEDSLQVTDRVWSLGYPGTSDVTGDGYKIAGVEDVTVQTGSVARFSDSVSTTNSSELKGHLIQHSADINHGNSGGPLLDQNGAVVGINTYGITGSGSGQTSYYALRIKYAKDALDSLGISYDLYKPKSGGSPVVIIAVVAAVAVIAAAAVVVVVLKKKKAAPAAQGTQPAANAPGNAGQAQAAQRAFIRSLAAQHNGMAMVVGAEPLVIGRDPNNCKLVYAEGTAGVSGRHCTVAYDAAKGDFIVTDLRSTYGTFLMTGQKLEANVPYRLKPGDGFYVGDRANAIRVELG